MFDSHLFQAGLWKIGDLFHGGDIIPFNVLANRGVPISSYMLWRGIVNIVMNRIVHPITDSTQPCSVQVYCNNMYRDITDLSSRELYQILVTKKKETPTAIEKYCNIFGLHAVDCMWDNVFGIFWNILYDNQIKEFQFKILHRILGTNHLAYKMGKISTPRCTFCNLYSEKIEHVFYDCIYVKQIWIEMEKIFTKLSNKKVVLSVNEAILGYNLDDKTEANFLLNKLIVYCKYYIWKMKLSHATLTVNGLMRCLQNHAKFDDTLEMLVLQ